MKPTCLKPAGCAAGLLLPLVLSAAVSIAAAPRPNLIVILSDDMGYSDLGCFGGEIRTPNLDRLAANGLRFTQFYNTARCCPTRAALLTGLYPHQAAIGHMMDNRGRDGYRGDLNRNCVTIAEALKPAGYRCYAVGKWHVTRHTQPDGPKHNWPLQRGFDRYYGTIHGAGSYFDPSALVRDNTMITAASDPDYRPAQFYYTDAITDHATRFIAEHQRAQGGKPFFLYVAYTPAHWPLHAKDSDIAKYRGEYDAGYEAIRQARFEKEQKLGLIDPKWRLSPIAGNWATVTNKPWEARCMEVYAAQVDCLDQGVGRIVAELEKQQVLDNTLVLFLQDNGGCAEGVGRAGQTNRADKPTLSPLAADFLQKGSRPKQTRDGWPVLDGPGVMPGPADTYIAYGRAWANVGNTPFREYKHWVHEGGISTPLIAHWPAGIEARGELRGQPGHLIDIMATCVDLAGATYPAEFNGQRITPLEGRSLAPAFENKSIQREAIFWEHEGNRALRAGPWKLVAKGPAGKWELYDLDADRSEMNDLAGQQPERVREMVAKWEAWAKRAQVLPWIWKPPYGQPRRGQGPDIDVPELDDSIVSARTNFVFQPGDELAGGEAPRIAGRGFTVTVEVLELARDGVLIAQGGSAHGFSLYLKDGRLCFATRRANQRSLVATPDPLPATTTRISARLARDGRVTLTVADRLLISAQTPGPLLRQPADGLEVGRDENGAVGDYEAPFKFNGRLGRATLVLE
jgi:arylsulfatase A-like enzyme